jgi:hypothetical protein
MPLASCLKTMVSQRVDAGSPPGFQNALPDHRDILALWIVAPSPIDSEMRIGLVRLNSTRHPEQHLAGYTGRMQADA